MGILKDELCRIMDMNDPLHEANKKLLGTWMIVNSKLMEIKEFLPTDNIIYAYSKKENKNINIKVETLDVFLPETGLYSREDFGAVFIHKVPKRQWFKSFHISFYQLIYLGKQNKGKGIMENLHKIKPIKFWVSPEADIYYRDNNIGYIDNNLNIVCTNILFKQELMDWNRDAH